MADLLRKQKENDLTTADLAGRSVPAEEPMGPKIVRREGTDAHAETSAGAEAPPMPLFSDSHMADFRAQWSKLQIGFVDEPRRSVENADKLVAAVMQRLADGFAKERSRLEKQWDRGDNVSTEELRVALQRYRSFFDRLLKL